MSELENKYEITEKSFTLVQSNKKIHDTALKTKPTTFFKDALKRFSKNKSSVAGAFILGFLILLTIFVPIFNTNNIKEVKKSEQFLAPKLFNAGTGFWDGTRSYKRITLDPATGYPADYYIPAVVKGSLKVDTEPTYINQANKYGTGGYVLFNVPAGKDLAELVSYSTKFTVAGNYQVTIELGNKKDVEGFEIGEYQIAFRYFEGLTSKDIILKDWSTDYTNQTFNISQVLAQNAIDNVEGKLVINLKGSETRTQYILVKAVNFTADSTVENYDSLVNEISFTDATKMLLLAKDPTTGKIPVGYWTSTGNKNVHNSMIYLCDFVYDTYAAVYDKQEFKFAKSDLDDLVEKGYCEYQEYDPVNTFKPLHKNCPIERITDVELNPYTGKILNVKAYGYRYLKYGYSHMPKFLFGTDDKGHDLFKKAFTGLRTSLVLGLCTAALCFAFGLVWGSISGYFGGNVDLAMERFCEILSGVPWIVIMTLFILHFGNGFGTFFIALCLTGWMSTAARTRTQFYRFKGREYVLASRTLGASDMRLIFKHILPNSMGTIITSSVLMIPSVIFNEATLAYLNLGLQGLTSFGVMMSDNQTYLQSYPNLVIFPAVIIALMMISFNLFGNGLRDAFNPSLKGSE